MAVHKASLALGVSNVKPGHSTKTERLNDAYFDSYDGLVFSVNDSPTASSLSSRYSLGRDPGLSSFGNHKRVVSDAEKSVSVVRLFVFVFYIRLRSQQRSNIVPR